MSDDKSAQKADAAHLYELLNQFQQGDNNGYISIINRFAGLINNSSYNWFDRALDDDLRSEIYLALFIRLRKFTIPDYLNSAIVRRNTLPASPNVPM